VDSIKLIDFGLARILNTDEPQFVECGTPEFVGKADGDKYNTRL
jgi:hypothetical protein